MTETGPHRLPRMVLPLRYTLELEPDLAAARFGEGPDVVDVIGRVHESQIGDGDRSGRIRTYNFPQGRMTDHRINLTLYKLDAIVAGDLAETVEALKLMAREELLKEQD